MRLAADFRDSMSSLDLVQLDRSDDTAIGLRRDLTIAYYNEAWAGFARENGGPELAALPVEGLSVLDAIAPPLLKFYRTLFERVIASGEPEDHEYLCHSPTLRRRFRVRLTPLVAGLLAVHHQVVEADHDTRAMPATRSRYVAEDGFAVQCGHCRLTRRADQPDTWDWVPALLDRRRPDVSHGLCPVCFAHYHPKAAQNRMRWLASQEPTL